MLSRLCRDILTARSLPTRNHITVGSIIAYVIAAVIYVLVYV